MNPHVQAHATATTAPRRAYRYYELLMAAFVTVLLCSNMIGPGKVCEVHLPLLGAVVFGAGNIFFPISYIFGDVLTEVYGYARARKVIWAGFGAMVFYVIMSQVVIRLPIYPKEPFNAVIQPAIETVFGPGWRIVTASIIAFWAGDFVNSYVLAKMKVWTRGRFLWMRTIGSTFAGQGVDSAIFYPLAFYGTWGGADSMWRVMAFNWAFKVGIEAIFTPMTYLVVGAVKRAEGEDYYDRATNFTPFSLKD
ncbi:hypothetical protein RAS2_03550 [Phycisphaerae bacterium RAS2]|nr:hypothetical protein RAS2_03550 [Phycisphaerae bacterium RAS2]